MASSKNESLYERAASGRPLCRPLEGTHTSYKPSLSSQGGGASDRTQKSATFASDALAPLWHLDKRHTFFAGPLTYNAPHQHGAPVYLAGLYGSFRLKMAGGVWLRCRTAVIPPGVVHELDLGGDPLAVLYLEAHAGNAATLAALMPLGRDVDGALVGTQGEFLLLRALFEDPKSVNWAGTALDDLLAFVRPRSRRPIDERLVHAITLMENRGGDLVTVGALQCASSVGLSASRFQHMFTREIGVPFRRYRAWMRMRRAIAGIVAGDTYTTAAHGAEFADQSHFAHDFRRTFGAAASVSLTKPRT